MRRRRNAPVQEFAPAAKQMTFAPMPPARRYAQMIEPGQAAHPSTAPKNWCFPSPRLPGPSPCFPALYSASYEQLFETDPQYGHDGGAFGEKFGAAMLRSASVRVFSDGIFAAAFHQDPRYYRIAHGSIIRRGLLSARQALVRRGDDGDNQINYSGIAGRAAAAALVMTYYPGPSVTARVVASTFYTRSLPTRVATCSWNLFPAWCTSFPSCRSCASSKRGAVPGEELLWAAAPLGPPPAFMLDRRLASNP